MATVQGPLHSLAASGSVGRLTFSEMQQHRAAVKAARNHSTVVRAKPRKPRVPPTAAQLAHRVTVKAIAHAWKILPPADKAKWTARGITVRVASRRGLAFTVLHGYALFLQEYFNQHATPPALPMLPAFNV